MFIILSLPLQILQSQNPSRTHRTANTTADTRCPYDIFLSLCIGFDVYTHLTVGRAITARDALATIGSNSKF